MNAKAIAALLLLTGFTMLFAAERAVVKQVKKDGTIKISLWSQIKLAGVEFPGSRLPDARFEYFHEESVEALQELIEGEEIKIYFVTDSWFPRKGRAYVYLDTVFVNAYMLREGYGYWDKKLDHQLAGELADYERTAKKMRKGLWLSPFSKDKFP